MKTFVHSGALGDVICSLPTVRALSEGEPARLLLRVGKPAKLAEGFLHPCGDVLLDKDFAGKLLPLLRQQSYLAEVGLFDGQAVDYELDRFRDCGFDLRRGHIARYYSYVWPCCPVLWEPWLSVEPDNSYRDTIIINRTSRYRSALSYGFLSRYTDAVFTGLKSEYVAFRKEAGFNLPFLETSSFVELASAIAGCRLFIGNQSFCWTLAEGTKVRRVAEPCPYVPNSAPFGPNGYEGWTQEGFEAIVERLLNDKALVMN